MRQHGGKALTRGLTAPEHVHDARIPRAGWSRRPARSDVPAFMVMDVMAAAARIEAAGGRVIQWRSGNPRPARRSRRSRRRGRRSVPAAGLHRIARHSLAAGADRAALFGYLPPRRGGRPRDCDDRIVGRRSFSRFCDVRAGRPGRDRQSGLSAVSAYPHRARLRAGADRDRTQRRASRSPAKACARRIASSGFPACWSRARPIRPAP